jgi:ABC-type branched-subunit amino acid transport system substrate-binding protein
LARLPQTSISHQRRRGPAGRGRADSFRRARARQGAGIGGIAARYTAKYGPINNYAANSYDSARIVLAAIEEAAAAKKAVPTRAAVLAAMRATKFQGIAYAGAAQWNHKGDNVAAVILSTRWKAAASRRSTRSPASRDEFRFHRDRPPSALGRR